MRAHEPREPKLRSPVRRTPVTSPTTKANGIFQQLRNLAYEQGPATKLPTVNEMCISFQTSRATINDVLEQLEQQHIVSRKRGQGIYVSPEAFQKQIALIFGDSVIGIRNQSPFWDSLWALFVTEAHRRVYTKNEILSLHVARERSNEAIPVDPPLARLLSSDKLSGVLAVGLDFDTAEWIKAHNLPLVAFAGNGTWNVGINGVELVRLATQSLLDQGCRKLRLWAPYHTKTPIAEPHGLPETKDNWGKYELANQSELFSQLLHAHGLVFTPSQVCRWEPDNTPGQILNQSEQGEWLVERLIQEGQLAQTDGIVITEDMLTLGAVRALQRSGTIRFIRIASHAITNSPILYTVADLITRVEVDPLHLVRSMYGIIDDLMEGKEPESTLVEVSNFQVRYT